MHLKMKNIFLILLVSCSSSVKDEPKTGTTAVEVNIPENSIPIETKIQEEDMIQGYPGVCDGNCKASFKALGEKINSDSTMDIYISGKGIDWSIDCCKWIWGEEIYNRPPPPGIKKVSIHLLDLDAFKIPEGDSEYGDSQIKKYVIAVAHCDSKGIEEQYDPFKTGKYSHPD
jgi:hypothetical protein